MVHGSKALLCLYLFYELTNSIERLRGQVASTSNFFYFPTREKRGGKEADTINQTPGETFQDSVRVWTAPVSSQQAVRAIPIISSFPVFSILLDIFGTIEYAVTEKLL
jgi:hypothetical protein